MPNSQQFCTFVLHGMLFGTPVTRVQEVILQRPMTPVPLAPHVVRGLINLRGQIVMVLDLRRQLGFPDFAAGQSPVHLVVHTCNGPVSLLVDDIGNVLELDKEILQRPPETLRGFSREVLRGVYQLPEGLLLELDIDRVVDLWDHKKSLAPNHVGPESNDSANAVAMHKRGE